MADGDPQGGGGSFLTQKWLGLPAIVWLGGAAVLAYFIMSRSSSTPANSTSGGGGQIHTGKTTVQSGAVRINVNANDDGNPQPKPPHHHHGGGGTKTFTIPKDETVGQFGEGRNWSSDTLQEVTQMKQPKGTTYAGQKLALNFPLKKGDTIARPYGKGT